MSKNLYKILFHKEYAKQVAEAFGNKLDKENYLVDKSGNRILTHDLQDINLDEFAGIAKGSRIYLKSDITSLIEYIDLRQNV